MTIGFEVIQCAWMLLMTGLLGFVAWRMASEEKTRRQLEEENAALKLELKKSSEKAGFNARKHE